MRGSWLTVERVFRCCAVVAALANANPAQAQKAGAGQTSSSAASRCQLPAPILEQATRFAQEINLLRTQPATYADIVEAAMASMDAQGVFERGGYSIRTVEGRAAVEEALGALRRQRSLKPLDLNICLSYAAQLHAQHLGRTGDVGHVGAGGSTPGQRAARLFGGNLSCGETVSAGPGTARDHVIALLIDDGVPDRGHRSALLDPSYRSLGNGLAPHPIGNVAVQMLCQQELPR
jgi:uncharacterized protein YkwD